MGGRSTKQEKEKKRKEEKKKEMENGKGKMEKGCSFFSFFSISSTRVAK